MVALKKVDVEEMEELERLEVQQMRVEKGMEKCIVVEQVKELKKVRQVEPADQEPVASVDPELKELKDTVADDQERFD